MADARGGVTKTFVTTRAVAHGFLAFAGTLFLASLGAAALDAKVPALVCSALAVTPLVIGILLLPLAARHEQAARDLIAGECILRWDYEHADWQAFVTAERARKSRLPLVFAGLFALSGIAAAMLAVEDDDLIADSLALTWTVWPGAGLALGGGVGAVIVAFRAARLRLMAREKGRFAFGSRGIYLTGCYWPIRDLGTGLTDVTVEGAELVFQFNVPRNTQKVRVPIPPAERSRTAFVVAQLAR